MRKILTAAISAAMLLSSVAPALAVTGAINWKTGRKSINTTVAVEADVVLVHNSSMAMGTITGAGSQASSGNNLAKGNDGKAEIITNTADSDEQTGASVNYNETLVDDSSCSSCSHTLAGNLYTGRKSTNTAVAVDADVVAVSNQSMAMGTITGAGSQASSGGNTAQGNGGATTINAGSASSSATSISDVNSNVTRVTR